MAKNKLRKFAEILEFPNVIECYNQQIPELTASGGQKIELRGRWGADFFKNDNPITLELACGGGEYAVELARRFPARNFLGVDLKGNRIWKGARLALDQNLGNCGFLRSRIEVIDHFFAAGEVDEIWITFPDPFLRDSDQKKRLTSPRFLDVYRKVLRPGGLVHLKTDEPKLFKFTLDTLADDPRCHVFYQNDDVHAKPLAFPELAIKTFYEAKDIAGRGRSHYLRFSIL